MILHIFEQLAHYQMHNCTMHNCTDIPISLRLPSVRLNGAKPTTTSSQWRTTLRPSMDQTSKRLISMGAIVVVLWIATAIYLRIKEGYWTHTSSMNTRSGSSVMSCFSWITGGRWLVVLGNQWPVPPIYKWRDPHCCEPLHCNGYL